MSSTRGKKLGGRSRGRGQVRRTDTQTTQVELPHRESEIDNPTTDIETTIRSRGRGQGRGATAIHSQTNIPSEHHATQVGTSTGSRSVRQGNGQTTNHTLNSLTGISPPEIDMEQCPFEEEMSNDFLSTRLDSMDPPIEGQSSDHEIVRDSRARGASHGIQAPNDSENLPFIQPDGLGYDSLIILLY